MTGEFTWGFDGWVYACHGYINTSRIRGRDGSEIEMNSGNVYRFKPDGSRVEQFTWGQVNPFGLAFDPLGNLYSCDCHTQPVYQLLRGATYPSFNKPHDGMGFGPEMTRDDHGSTAIAGIAYYAADAFPAEYRDTIFIGNVLSNRINHDRVEWRGATPRAVRLPDFLVSDDPWFRPVDIKLGPDGALYVADFYNRVIGHYEVPLTHPGRDRERGRIWRISYRGPNGVSPNSQAKDRAKFTVDELIEDLAHANLTVRMIATNELASRSAPQVLTTLRERLSSSSNTNQRIHLLWAWERIAGVPDDALQSAANGSEKNVRIHALRIMAERRQLSETLHRLAVAKLEDSSELVSRCAAEVLARHPALSNLRPLLEIRHRVPDFDTHLRHAVRLALREHLRDSGVWKYLESTEWDEHDRRALADVAAGVPSQEAAAFLLAHLRRYPESFDNRVRYAKHVARFGTGSNSSSNLLNLLRGDRGAPMVERVELWTAYQQGAEARGGRLNDSELAWGAELVRGLIASPDPRLVTAGIELAGRLKMQAVAPIFLGFVQDRSTSEEFQLASVTALAAMDSRRAVPLLGGILDDSTMALPVRQRAATLLADANRSEVNTELLRGLTTAPEKLAVVIARGLANSRAGASQLLELIQAGKASPRLLQDAAVQIRLTRVDLPQWRERVADLTRGLPTATQAMDGVLSKRKASFAKFTTDTHKGMSVFEQHCGICHQLANKGAKIGPQLDGIGIRGLDRLLEDIIDPHRNVDQAFRATTLALTDGRIITGLVLREEGDVLVLADEQGKEVRVSKAQVEQRSVSALSSMPANLIDQLPEAEFCHLLAYLLAQKPSEASTDRKSRE